MRLNRVILCTVCISLTACGTKSFAPSDKHIQQSNSAPATAGSIPSPSKRAVILPPPQPSAKVETYSVVVTNLLARDILFALARDAKVNIDIHPGINGIVTLNAINQTLPQILDRISKQVDMRYELENGNLVVMPDSPFLRTYKIDYVNMSRDSDAGITSTNQIGGISGNSSQLSIKNSSKNRFWETLIKNIDEILRETDKEIVSGRRSSVAEEEAAKSEVTKSEGATETSAKKTETKGKTGDQDYKDYKTLLAGTVIANPETGIISVRATGKQHDKIREFVTQVIRSARRQVLIEATIAEVRLNSNYQQGINWSSIATGATGFTLTQLGTGVGAAASTGNMFTLGYADPTSKFGNLSGAVKLLDSFGDVKVLSSPKLSVLNNQTAMLRVVDNNVYFIVNSAITPCSPAPCTPIITYTTTVNTVTVGFSMSITPQINDSDTVLLNVRPTITRLLTDKKDPTPSLLVENLIPQVSTREMESILKIENNQIAILGGLMQDEIKNNTDEIPVLGDIPVAGNLFKNRNDTKTKTELVIFLRPVVIKDASLEGDYAEFKNSLPDANFLKPEDEKAKP